MIRRFPLLAAASTALLLALAPVANAQQQKQTCTQGQQGCVQTQGGQKAQPQAKPAQAQAQSPSQGKSQQHAQAQPQAGKSAAKAGPKVGDSARNGKAVPQAGHPKLKSPPKGQEYRELDGRVVLVDSKTLNVLTIVGLASALLN
ncbi:hypothetical protein [Poseidonocella sp. HB161398]|uniref:hypothetical protein n=1 Tax=Poseidonocella sp. HB161398 TaxID=2320855 RepID=UPI001486218C|nr:hypothetical protein [Poseidonocella sp. HB161398]